jgi:hypothetical protein
MPALSKGPSLPHPKPESHALGWGKSEVLLIKCYLRICVAPPFHTFQASKVLDDFRWNRGLVRFMPLL